MAAQGFPNSSLKNFLLAEAVSMRPAAPHLPLPGDEPCRPQLVADLPGRWENEGLGRPSRGGISALDSSCAEEKWKWSCRLETNVGKYPGTGTRVLR